MLNLNKYFIRLYKYFFDKPQPVKKTSLLDKEQYIGGLIFALTNDLDIDVSCILPETNGKNLTEITSLAEKYGQFLLSINEGYLKNDLINILKQHKKTNQEDMHTLLCDNIIIAWSLFHTELLKSKQYQEKNDQPVIRPLSVFSGEIN